jgi:hypothetical protein
VNYLQPPSAEAVAPVSFLLRSFEPDLTRRSLDPNLHSLIRNHVAACVKGEEK